MVKRADRSRDQATIRGIEDAYDLAWNRGNAHSLVASFTRDAVVVNPRGEVVVGKAAFEDLMTRLLSGPFKGTTHTSTILRIHFPTEDVAVVDGEATLTGIPQRDGSTTSEHVRFTDILVKTGDRWWIAHVRACELRESPTDEPVH